MEALVQTLSTLSTMPHPHAHFQSASNAMASSPSPLPRRATLLYWGAAVNKREINYSDFCRCFNIQKNKQISFIQKIYVSRKYRAY